MTSNRALQTAVEADIFRVGQHGELVAIQFETESSTLTVRLDIAEAEALIERLVLLVGSMRRVRDLGEDDD